MNEWPIEEEGIKRKWIKRRIIHCQKGKWIENGKRKDWMNDKSMPPHLERINEGYMNSQLIIEKV